MSVRCRPSLDPLWYYNDAKFRRGFHRQQLCGTPGHQHRVLAVSLLVEVVGSALRPADYWCLALMAEEFVVVVAVLNRAVPEVLAYYQD